MFTPFTIYITEFFGFFKREKKMSIPLTAYDGCYYTSLLGQAFAWTQLLPSMVSLVLSVLTFVTSQFIFVFLAWYLHGIQLLLWAIQLYLRVDRPNPLCQEYHTYAFPSIEGFYIGALAAFIIGYSLRWHVKQPWYVWVTILVFFVAPPTVLVFLAYNRWYEVVISLLIGIVTSSIFIIILWVYIYDTIPYLKYVVPINWLHYKDTYICTNKNYDQRCHRVEKALEKYRDLNAYPRRG